jgi:hypothetical protein
VPRSLPRLSRADVVKLWLHRQGLAAPRASARLTKRAFVEHLERTGALQIDPVNAVDRAHYLTLWSRFGPYDRRRIDRWVYRDRAAYEYWGHEASILPISHLPLGRRRMRRFPGSWARKGWWERFSTSPASQRRTLRRLRAEGPLESAHFERRDDDPDGERLSWGAMKLPKEDRRSLKLLWHRGKAAVSSRRHFRVVYDVAERVYPEGRAATTAEYEDSWLLTGLSGNGVASERHLVNYLTAPNPTAADRERILARNLRKGRVVEVRAEGVRGAAYALPEHLDLIARLPEPEGTTLVCPFDSLLWQRGRALELLGFDYKIEIYVPEAKRRHGYYVLPILHEGRLVGRLDPKLHRDRGLLEVRNLKFEPGFRGGRAFRSRLRDTLEDLASFLGASELKA